jgi:tetratricopeptide (TPR) repeat protein
VPKAEFHQRQRFLVSSAIALEIEMTLKYENMPNNLDNQPDIPIDSEPEFHQHPQDASEYYNRGRSRDLGGDREGALADYNCTIQLDPHHAKAYVNRGLLLDRIGNRQAALADYDRAIELDDRSATNYYNRANVRYRLEDLQGALSDYDRSIQLDSTRPKAFYNRGLVCAYLGNREGARQDLQTAAELFRQQDREWDYQRTLEKVHEV